MNTVNGLTVVKWTGKPYGIGKDGRCLAVLMDSESNEAYALISDATAHRRVAAAGPLPPVHVLRDDGKVDHAYLRRLDYREDLADWVATREWHLIDGVVPVGDGECLVAVLEGDDSPLYTLASSEGVSGASFPDDLLRSGDVEKCG